MIYFHNVCEDIKLEAQWAEPVSLTFHSASETAQSTEPKLGRKHLHVWKVL
jgi:hypothetical protein